jgi:hypothetical protein
MTEAASSIFAKENRRNNNKLTRVVSTKLSPKDDDFLQQLTDKAYRVRAIKERSKSKFLRLIITLVFSELRNRPDLVPLLHPNQP